MASYNPYAPMYGDPGSLYPRVYEFSLPPHLGNYDPRQPSRSYPVRSTSQSRVWGAYRDGSRPPDPAYAQYNAAGPVPRAPHAFYGPDRPIEGRLRARARRPSVHSQTLAGRWPHPGLEDVGQMVVVAKSRKTRRRVRGSSGESPVELCTPPLGQVPHPNLFPRTSASLRSSRSTGPPFVVPPALGEDFGVEAASTSPYSGLTVTAPSAPRDLSTTTSRPTTPLNPPLKNYLSTHTMSFHPRSMFLDDSSVHSRSPYGSPRRLDAYSRRKSRSDIRSDVRSDVSSDYEHDRMGLVRTKSEYVRPEYERPMTLVRSASDFDDYDRPPLLGRYDDWEDDHARDYDPRRYRVEYVNDLHSSKLRHKKSLKRMFEVPSGLSNLFDSPREKERRYFNSEGRFGLHTLLDANAVRNGAPHLRFDILRPFDIRVVGDGYTHDPRVLDEPATYPAISKLRILVADLPWVIRVQNRNGVTLRDIAESVCTFFRAEMGPREWSMLDGAHKIAARRAFSLQQSEGASGGLRRFECLVDTTMFMGMVKNDALVRRVAGDDAVEWTWVMLGPR
ncbi:hypothetical protein FRC07_002263 [Ceratobasidium sp. 392]|nr:hypothetical protein FRC07_002263 [Ceratobasidium sp. 392]